MSRPELTGHASLFYNAKEARKYDSSSRMVGVQREITERAIELLRLNSSEDGGSPPCLVLDIGCGSGLSGAVLEEKGHVWIGCDVSRDMLSIAQERNNNNNSRTKNHNNNTKKNKKNKNNSMDESSSEDENDDDDDESDGSGSAAVSPPNQNCGDLLHHDMGTGLPFRPATFDACISISALQWLCYSNATCQNPKRRLVRFFSSLYTVLKRGGRAVLQFYPETAEQAVLISETATAVGFTGGVVVDYPNSAKAKKHYLVLGFDRNHPQARKKALQLMNSNTNSNTKKTAAAQVSVVGGAGNTDEDGLQPTCRTNKNVPKKKRGGTKTKEWILHKKQAQRNKGKSVRADTKYTARKRPTKF